MSRTSGPVVYRALQGYIAHETDKAILLKVHAPEHPENSKSFWFPLSQCASIHRCYDEIMGTFDVLMLSEWILKNKGVIGAALDKNPATADPKTVANCEPIGVPTDNFADNFPGIAASAKGVDFSALLAKTREKKARDKLVASRLPYKDDENPLEGELVDLDDFDTSTQGILEQEYPTEPKEDK